MNKKICSSNLIAPVAKFEIIHISFFKARTRINLIVLNIIISDLIISSIGIFLDVMGIVGVVGTSMQKGSHVGSGLCQLEGFIYIISGKIYQID